MITDVGLIVLYIKGQREGLNLFMFEEEGRWGWKQERMLPLLL